MFVKCLYIIKRYIQLISVSMVQWLKHSPETRELVSSSLNSDFFFFFFLLHLKEIFAKTTLAASETNTLFELYSDIIKGWQNLLQAVHFGYGSPYNTLVKVTQ